MSSPKGPERTQNDEGQDRMKTCPKCQQKFACQSATGGCWCESIELNNQTLAHLRANYDDCLCKACLTEYQTALGK